MTLNFKPSTLNHKHQLSLSTFKCDGDNDPDVIAKRCSATMVLGLQERKVRKILSTPTRKRKLAVMVAPSFFCLCL